MSGSAPRFVGAQRLFAAAGRAGISVVAAAVLALTVAIPPVCSNGDLPSFLVGRATAGWAAWASSRSMGPVQARAAGGRQPLCGGGLDAGRSAPAVTPVAHRGLRRHHHGCRERGSRGHARVRRRYLRSGSQSANRGSVDRRLDTYRNPRRLVHAHGVQRRKNYRAADGSWHRSIRRWFAGDGRLHMAANSVGVSVSGRAPRPRTAALASVTCRPVRSSRTGWMVRPTWRQ
jgi:hypothetical protein